MGWDDNGLPTERRVQNYYGVRCDPSLPYDPSFAPPEQPPKPPISVSRPNFIELCDAPDRGRREGVRAAVEVSRPVGRLVDDLRDDRQARAARVAAGVPAPAAARAGLPGRSADAVGRRLQDRGRAGRARRPRDAGRVPPHPLRACRRVRRVVEIDTTRPELIPACVALVAHPDDERYQPLFGTEVHHAAVRRARAGEGARARRSRKGQRHRDDLHVRRHHRRHLVARAAACRCARSFRPDGTLRPVTWGAPGGNRPTPTRAQRHYDELAGLSAAKARAKIVEQLRESGDLVGEPRPITHAVKFYEKGDRPLEIVTSRQWFIKTIEFREALLARGRELQWHPAYMRARYENWVERPERRLVRQPAALLRRAVPGLVSARRRRPRRLRRVRSLPREDRLPIDPSTDVPDGLPRRSARRAGRLRRRSRRDGHVGDLVADAADRLRLARRSRICSRARSRWTCGRRRTTSSARGCSTRSCASHLEHDSLPWTNAAISGWVLDPDRKKMSKSKGNVVTPMALLEEHGSDGVRYWAASGRPGTDTAFDAEPDEGRPAAGDQAAQRVEVRADARAEPQRRRSPRPVDRAMLRSLAALVDEATAAFEGYDYARVLQRTEDVLLALLRRLPRAGEGPPLRRAGRRRRRRRRTPRSTAALSVMLRLFAPFLPFVTEEVWSWWRDGSIHHGGRGRPRDELRRCVADNRPSAARRSSDVRVGDRRAVRSPQAAVRSQAAAEGADHEVTFTAEPTPSR